MPISLTTLITDNLTQDHNYQTQENEGYDEQKKLQHKEI